jgi:outer membrane protein assembly factor BamB
LSGAGHRADRAELGFPRVNRGVAILDDMVYVGTLDGFVALDAKSGAQRWRCRPATIRPTRDHRRAARGGQ